jgi:hypothetical protein
VWDSKLGTKSISPMLRRAAHTKFQLVQTVQIAASVAQGQTTSTLARNRGTFSISALYLTTPRERRLATEDLMKPDKVPISDVQTLKAQRDELFRDFEDHPWKLSLSTEIKIIDDQIAELGAGKKRAGIERTK